MLIDSFQKLMLARNGLNPEDLKSFNDLLEQFNNHINGDNQKLIDEYIQESLSLLEKVSKLGNITNPLTLAFILTPAFIKIYESTSPHIAVILNDLNYMLVKKAIEQDSESNQNAKRLH